MHLVYSKISPGLPPNKVIQNEDEMLIRYMAYQEACEKHRNKITEIQKYIPGWMPKFR
jgi:hypothetical protein